MPRDGCKECSRRRIKCDKGQPECAKCLKKGIKCTGMGRQFKFVGGIATRGKYKGRTAPVAENASPGAPGLGSTAMQGQNCLSSTAEDANQDRRDFGLPEANAMILRQREVDIDACDAVFTLSDRRFPLPPLSNPGSDLILESLKPGIKMLFRHFSDTIASIMVVFDRGSNGYRDLILPLAHHDDLIQRSVSVVAAFHLSSRRPDLLPYAESGRAAIIQRLRSDASSGVDDKVFNITTWVTILLLLVAETVTGSNDFVHLYPMLTTLLNQNKLLTQVPHTEQQFLLQQSRMFQLFVPPLIDTALGLDTLNRDLNFYFDFLLSTQFSAFPDLAGHMNIFRDAITQARNIYTKQAMNSYTPGQLHSDLQRLRSVVLPVTFDTPGMHTLPWVYFIAAASSQDLSHRAFFSGRLLEVYRKTHMNNIVVALERLEQIWRLQPNGEWARNPNLVNPVLII